MTTTIAQISQDARVLAARLLKVAAGDTIEYAELSALVGRDVRTKARSALTTAIRHAQRDGLVFGCVRTVGLKRLTPAEVPAIADHSLASIRRRSRRTVKTMLTALADPTAENGAVVALHARVSHLGALAEFATPKVAAKIDAAVQTSGGELPIGRTKELF